MTKNLTPIYTRLWKNVFKPHKIWHVIGQFLVSNGFDAWHKLHNLAATAPLSLRIGASLVLIAMSLSLMSSLVMPQACASDTSGTDCYPQIAPASVQESGIATGNNTSPHHLSQPSVAGQGNFVLSDKDQELYKQIFVLHDQARWDEADALITQISDPILLGYAMYARYMHPYGYTSTAEELADWLAHYADHVQADRLYSLAQKRKKSGVFLTKPATGRRLAVGTIDEPVHTSGIFIDYEHKGRSRQGLRDVKNHMKRYHRAIQRNILTKTLGQLKDNAENQGLSDHEVNWLKGQIASRYFHLGHRDKAYELASKAADDSGNKTPLAAWIAGLSAWSQDEFDLASHYFALAAQNESGSTWFKSAAAFWAARSFEEVDNDREHDFWLEKAASYPRTFYGLLALGKLDRPLYAPSAFTHLTERQETILRSVRRTYRAMALVDIGKTSLAASEIERIRTQDDRELAESILAFANQAGLVQSAMKLASDSSKHMDQPLIQGFFPVMPWAHQIHKIAHDQGRGHELDIALLHAVARQESRFNPHARNRGSGAVGLMQLMPRTARAMMPAEFRRQDGSFSEKLRNPVINMKTGQAYLNHLMTSRRVNSDLFRALAAYNAGPTKMGRWQRDMPEKALEDPLLFIEMIPVNETRAFVERVMTNLWIYRMRFGQEPETLARLADGDWPIYRGATDPLPNRGQSVFARAENIIDRHVR